MPIFIGATREDQLLVEGGTIAVLADNGQFVHLYSLATGEMRHRLDGGQDVEARLPTGAADWNVSLMAVGPRLYAYSPRTLVSYNIDHPESSWNRGGFVGSLNYAQALPGQDFLIMIDQPLQRLSEGGKPLPYCKVDGFSRAQYKDSSGQMQESGSRSYSETVANTAGLTGWQAVDGGLAYLSGDQKLHWLRGARP
jgi:hypothetical protein